MYVAPLHYIQLKYLTILLPDKERYLMTRIQFGWSLPSGPPEGISRNAYMEGVQKGFEADQRAF
jgi:hypothetical protein